MNTVHVKNIEGQTNLPIRGTEMAAGYDIVATDDPIVKGEIGRELALDDGTKIPLYKSIDYLEYHTQLFIAPVSSDCHLIFPRSSIRKYNLVLANSIGLIDNDYRGEILVSFKYVFQPEDFVIQYEEVTTPVGDEATTKVAYVKPTGILGGINWTKVYRKGDKIAQLVAEKTNPSNYVFVSELTATARGEGGHGSTGQQAQAPTTTSEPYSGGLADLYNKAGGIPIRKRYIDQVKERDRMEDSHPHANQPMLPTGIKERKPQ